MGAKATSLTRAILLDNTMLTNFALVNRADLVMRLWPTLVCTTPEVSAEYGIGVSSGSLPTDAWADLPIVTLTAEEINFAAGLSPRLGKGERTCLAAAFHRQGLFATDDLDARRAAWAHGVTTTGTLGILVLCVQQHHLSRGQADALLAEMIASGYRSPMINLEQLIDE